MGRPLYVIEAFRGIVSVIIEPQRFKTSVTGYEPRKYFYSLLFSQFLCDCG